MTISQTIGKSLAWAMTLFILCAGAMTYVWYVDTAQMEVGSIASKGAEDMRPAAKWSPRWAMEKADGECWRSGDEPAAEIPTTILFQGEDYKTRRISNPQMVHDAFAEALGMGEASFDFVALCV